MGEQEVVAERWEWQVAEGSSMAHIIDAARPNPWRGEPGYRKSGPRSTCGRYPQRHNPPWFSLEVGAEADKALDRYWVQKCADCDEAALVRAETNHAEEVGDRG